MSEVAGEPADKLERWNSRLGPYFAAVWPLDGALREKGTSEDLVRMALESDNAFPEIVEAIRYLVIPYQLYDLRHSLRFQEHDAMVGRFPRAFIRLANAVIDPDAFPLPSDLAQLLEDVVAADASVANDPAYTRLLGLSRHANS